MKLIIAGSRTIGPSVEGILELLYLSNAIDNDRWCDLKEVISGGATGVDSAAKKFAEWCEIPFKEFPADWTAHGKAAGPIRNKQMAEYGDVLLLIWDGESRGSASMKKQMELLKKPVFEVIIKVPKTVKVLYGQN